MADKLKSYLTLAIKIAIAVGLIIYLVRSGHLDPKGLWDLMTWPNLLIALGLVGVSVALAAWRWILLLRSRQLPLPLGYGYELYLIGIFFNHALPGAVGGDLVRGFYLVRDYPERRLDVALSVVIDRVLGLYSYFILSLIAIAWDFDFVQNHEQIRWISLLCVSIFTAMTLFFLVAFSQRLSQTFGLSFFEKRVAVLHRLLCALQVYGKNRRMIASSVLVSLISQVFTMIFFYQLSHAMGATEITWPAVLFSVPMGFVITAIPIAPAGIGVGQLAFAYLFQTYVQVPTQFGATAITAYQLVMVCWGLLGAFFYLRRRKPADWRQMNAVVEA